MVQQHQKNCNATQPIQGGNVVGREGPMRVLIDHELISLLRVLSG